MLLDITTLGSKLNFPVTIYGLGSPVIDVIVKKDSLVVYLLKFFGIFRNFLVGRCGSVSGKGKTLGYEGSGFDAWFDPGLRFSFFFIETLSTKGRKFLSVVKMEATVYERDNCVDDTVER